MQQALAGHVLLPIDGRLEASQALTTQHGVLAYPTFVVLNAQGELLQGWVGYGSVVDWAERFAAVVADPVTTSQRRERLNDRPTYEDARILAEDALRARRYLEAVDYLRQGMAIDPPSALAGDAGLLLAEAALLGAGQQELTLAEATGVLAEVLHASADRPHHAVRVSELLFQALRQERIDLAQAAPLLDLARPRLTEVTDASWTARRDRVLAEVAWQIEHDPARALALKLATLPADWEQNGSELNSVAWWCFERGIALDRAETFARAAVEILSPGADQSDALDTLAEIVHLRGDTAQAFDLIVRALGMNPGSSYLQQQHARFQALLEGRAPAAETAG